MTIESFKLSVLSYIAPPCSPVGFIMCEQDGLMRAQHLFVKQAEGTNAGQGLCSVITD